MLAFSPRRSRRLAAKCKAADPALQARNVLLVKLILTQQAQATSMELLDKYESTFAAPLSPSKHEAFKVLFQEDSFLDDFAPEVEALLPAAQYPCPWIDHKVARLSFLCRTICCVGMSVA